MTQVDLEAHDPTDPGPLHRIPNTPDTTAPPPPDDWGRYTPDDPPAPAPARNGTSNGTRPTRARLEPLGGRTVPHDLAAERALLGAMLLNPDAATHGLTHVDPADYYNPAHAHIHGAIRALHANSEPVDPATVADHLRTRQLLDTIGGPGLIAQIVADTPSLRNADRYADIICGHAARRTLYTTFTGLADRALNLDDPAHLIDQALEQLEQVDTGGATIRPLPWEDVAAVMRGDVDPIRPTILTRTDGQPLIYPGLTHWLMGEPGKGKTWVALAAAAEQIRNGRAVVYLDYEGSARIVGERLAALGLTPDQVDAHLLYHRPGIVTRDIAARLTAAVTATDTALVIIDGVAKALAAAGYSEDKAPDVLAWLVTAVNPLADAGAAVLMLDHVVKEKDGRGLWARGSGAKLGEVSGAAWVLRPDRPFSRTQAGRAHLVQAKDREGHVATDGATAAVVTFTPGHDGTLTIALDPPTGGATGPDEQFRPTGYMERISKHVEQLNDAGIAPSVNESIGTVSGKRKHLAAALDTLVAEGFITVEQGPRGARLHRTTRPYRQADDPRSDRYDPPPSDTI